MTKSELIHALRNVPDQALILACEAKPSAELFKKI